MLDAMDRQAEKDRDGKAPSAYRVRVWVVLATVAISLLAVHYLKSIHSFHQTIRLLESLFGIEGHGWLRAVRSGSFGTLWAYVWWSGWHYLMFLLVPMGVIRWILKDSIRSYGWQMGEAKQHWKIYAVTMVFFVLLLSWFSFHNSSFAHYYPYYHLAHRSWFDLLAWETIYMTQFVALEFFFRGFFLQGLRVPFGSMALPVMVIPYMMIHLPKLWPEATGAIVFGLFLGFLALRSRSIWGGVAIHVSVALTLDISGMIQTRGWPQVWWPA
jgi:membrane protease YdiL (CAAX protease family)